MKRSIKIWPERKDLNLVLSYDAPQLIFTGNRTPEDEVGIGNLNIMQYKNMSISVMSYNHPQLDVQENYIQLFLGGSDYNQHAFEETYYLDVHDPAYEEIEKMFKHVEPINKNVKVL